MRARATRDEDLPDEAALHEGERRAAPADETLIQSIAAAVVRTLTAQPVVGQTDPLLEQSVGQSLPAPPPNPKRNLDSELVASVPTDAVTPYGTHTNTLADPRTPPPSAYESGAGTLSSKPVEPVAMEGWQAGQIQLASTKFDGRVGNWSRWKTEMQTIFHWRELLQLMQGREYLDEERARRDESWKKCYETRERKAHTEIVLSLHGDLLDRFKSDIETANPAQVWAALLPTYDGTQGTNAVYLKQDLYARRLHQGEQVTEYVGDLQQMRRELERMEITLAEGEMAGIVLSNAVAVYPSNAVAVYPSIANDHTQWRSTRPSPTTTRSVCPACVVARDQLSRENRDADQGVQRQVNLVTRNSSSGCEQQQQGGNKRRYNGGGGRGSGEKKRQDDEVARKRRDEMAEKKRHSECNACHQRGHWWKECPERKSTDPREICTMAGAVLRRVEKEQKDDRPADAQRDRQQDHPRVDFVGTHPVTLSVDRQRADVNSYSKIYTRHELAALVGRDVEERLGQARDTQREEQSVEYSPTSPTDADADSLHGATGLLPTRRVLVNVTGDLALLNNVKNLKQL
ncbi:hypothetical protein PF008_g11055 [Phytophthora fragariae]|uniref:CCHC-type domain-containing protein n=1 Tax=Phytophthora fragariae TaxID=53985 RepID=A0A6G0RRW9_9STRA|nr:hypothetical protein PF008_g11055 [Phytophthora fragariae]